MTENRELRQSRKAATVADLQGVDGRPFFVFELCDHSYDRLDDHLNLKS